MPTFEETLAHLTEDDDNPVSFTIEAEGIKKPVQLHLFRHGTTSFETPFHLVILTHGAGGTSVSTACLHLVQGLASCSTSTHPLAVLAFDGSMNLKARVKAFLAAIEYASACSQVETISLAGRSMGCRAAAIAYAASENAKLSGKLVLESYPLIGKGEDARKQVLIDLPDKAEVLFVIGSHDEMCPLDALGGVRATEMQARSNLIHVQDLDHGMACIAGCAVEGGSKKEVAERLGKAAGKIAGDWLVAEARQLFMHLHASWAEEGVKQGEWQAENAMQATESKVGEGDRKSKRRTPPAQTMERSVGKRRKRA